jgi:hypothetical protein
LRGLDPRIHVFVSAAQGADGRAKPGQDENSGGDFLPSSLQDFSGQPRAFAMGDEYHIDIGRAIPSQTLAPDLSSVVQAPPFGRRYPPDYFGFAVAVHSRLS